MEVENLSRLKKVRYTWCSLHILPFGSDCSSAPFDSHNLNDKGVELKIDTVDPHYLQVLYLQIHLVAKFVTPNLVLMAL